MNSGVVCIRRVFITVFAAALAMLAAAASSYASTYVVYIPLDSPIYDELDTLNSLGYLDDYINEVKPISRIEAARLTLEAQSQYSDSSAPDQIAHELIHDLRDQLHQEIGWIQSNSEDNPPPAILQPVDRAELQYIYSHGAHRFWQYGPRNGNYLTATEGTPLLPDNDGIPTSAGSNEVVRWGAWGGVGGFLTGYGEAAATGPIGNTPSGTSRIRALGAEAVASLGNFAISAGQEEMLWGNSHFASIMQSDNAAPLPGIRVQLIHPTLLPGPFRYLGQFKFQGFFARLDAGRQTFVKADGTTASFAHPYLCGQIFAFKPLPTFEFGFTHVIMFGGSGNNNYSAAGFIGRATGLNTGTVAQGNTNSQGGVYLKFTFPRLRGSILYVQTLGEDNLTDEAAPVGRFLPFLSVSYQGGYYLPRLTADGKTDFLFEWTVIEPNYCTHSDPLYWSYNDHLMDDQLGPNSSELDFQVGRWFPNLTKGSVDLFWTNRAPKISGNTFVPASLYGPASTLSHEEAYGIGFDVLAIPQNPRLRTDVLAFGKTNVSFQYVDHMNFGTSNSFRALVTLTIGIKPTWDGLVYK